MLAITLVSKKRKDSNIDQREQQESTQGVADTTRAGLFCKDNARTRYQAFPWRVDVFTLGTSLTSIHLNQSAVGKTQAITPHQ
jgi:hypothetical protein